MIDIELRMEVAEALGCKVFPAKGALTCGCDLYIHCAKESFELKPYESDNHDALDALIEFGKIKAAQTTVCFGGPVCTKTIVTILIGESNETAGEMFCETDESLARAICLTIKAANDRLADTDKGMKP